MASNQTPNYGLSQWKRTDQVRMEDFNADNAKIDAAIQAVDRRVEGKADVSAVDRLNQTVSQQVGALAGKGNCQISTISYVGNGRFGQNAPCSLSFPKLPKLVLVFASNGYPLFQMPPSTSAAVDGRGVTVSWGERSVSWYSTTSEGIQLNISGITYHGLVLMEWS